MPHRPQAPPHEGGEARGSEASGPGLDGEVEGRAQAGAGHHGRVGAHIEEVDARAGKAAGDLKGEELGRVVAARRIDGEPAEPRGAQWTKSRIRSVWRVLISNTRRVPPMTSLPAQVRMAERPVIRRLTSMTLPSGANDRANESRLF